MWNILQDELGGGVWPRLLVALVDTGAKGLILMAAAGLSAVALRHKAAAARHLVWMLALCGLLLLPVVSLMMPKWTLPILPAIGVPAVAPIAVTPPLATAPAAPAVVSTPVAEIAPAVTNVIPPTARRERPLAPIGAAPPESAQAPMIYGAWLLVTWLAFALLSLAPFAAGVVAVARMRRRAKAFSEGDLQALASALGRSIGLKHPVRLLRGPAGSMPMATGFRRPAVFLPDDALAWTEEKRHVVLLHELAHVKRRDCLTHAIARTATALHWFNPLAWLALRQLRIEREHACDDLVLAAGERPSAYAENLLEIARTLCASTVVSAAAITMAQKSQLEGRLLAVLDTARNRGRVTKRLVAASILGTIFVLALVSSVDVARSEGAKGNGANLNNAVFIPQNERPDGDFSVEFPGGYRARVVGVGDSNGKPSETFWTADGKPLGTAPEGFQGEQSFVTPSSESVGRMFFVELLPPPENPTLGEVAFKCQIDSPGSSGSQSGSGTEFFMRNTLGATLPTHITEASIKVGLAVGPWRTVIRSCLGCSSETSGDEGEHSVVFSDAFIRESENRVIAMHNNFEADYRVVATDASGLAHPLVNASASGSGGMIQSEWILRDITPTEVKALEIQTRTYEWMTISGIALYPTEKTAQSNAQQSSVNSAYSPYSVFNHDYLGTLLEDPNLLTHIAGDAITPPAADTSWGPVVNGLQAAVRFIPEKNTYALGEAIGMEFLVRNIGPIPLEFLTSKWRNGDQCVVTDNQGVKRASGTIHYSGEGYVRRVKLAPGEVAAIDSTSFTIMPEDSGRSPLHPVGTWARSHAGIHNVQFEIYFPDSHMRSGENAPRPDDWTGTLMTGERTIQFVDDPELFRDHSVFQIRMVAHTPDDKGSKVFPWEASSRPLGDVDKLWLLDDVLVGDGDLAAVEAVPGASSHQYAIEISLNEKASERLALATGENIGHRMACMYQEMVYAAPILNGPVGDGKLVVGGKFSKDVAESIVSEIRAANALDTEAPFMQASTTPILGPEVEVTVRHSGENCMIDFDTGKLFTPPNFNGTEDAFAWCAKNGIDAGGGNQPEVRGLIGMDLVLNPEANAIWDNAATNGALNHDAFKYGKPGNPVYLSAKGELPATWTFKTREGGLGIVQILGFDDEEPRGVKIRYRMME